MAQQVQSAIPARSGGNHPKGLPYLFLTEMWERFGYYLMLGIFVLYMKETQGEGGMGFPAVTAYDIFGTFIAFTYLTPFLGGFLADRKLGYINSVYLGGALMGLGYMGLALPGLGFFYASIALIIIGNGFFKPSISTLLGNLYSEEQYKDKKDAGYNIFYMGINIGAFVCNIIGAFMRNKFDWSAAFLSAGVGMFLGLIVFTIGLKHYRHANVLKPAVAGDTGIGQVLSLVFLPAIIAGVLGWMIPGDILGSDSTDAFIAATIPVIIFFVSLYYRANKDDKRPIAALLAIFAVSVMFWAVFKQNGTVLTDWAQNYTDRQVSESMEQAAGKLYLAEEVSSKESMVTQYDNQFRTLKDDNGKEVKAMGRSVYFRNIDPARIPADGKPVYLVNTELFQSVNPGWVVMLTPLVVAFFAFLRRKKKEPSTPAKIAWGMLISALSTLVMVAAVYAGHNGEFKVSALWLVGCYGVITIGELFLSPMGLSLVSKLSPPRLTALMMGGFFLSTSIGNKLSGILAKTWYNYEDKSHFFLVNCGLLLVSAAIGFVMLKWLNKIMQEKGVK
ncbi:peptide MFS transporter [Taibaiella chishuiensis]|uniref:POT family proton-dependent oligopeptide transporter n=1 Tax=Taibaiella chishuiensis TaxID=1434707 RepID=A0A2P8D1J9_9BACT|nr:peptide MFS transporter [Taibaiella chishuiensis]PSK91082.1 POT family proton-dependent oligopeptide transporter [Taibaiella chishuiensis]